MLLMFSGASRLTGGAGGVGVGASFFLLDEFPILIVHYLRNV